MGLLDKLKGKHDASKHDEDGKLDAEQDKKAMDGGKESEDLSYDALVGNTDLPTDEPDAGAGVAIQSYGGGPRFDQSGPGPQAHDFREADAQPQNLAVREPLFAACEVYWLTRVAIDRAGALSLVEWKLV